MKVNQGQIELPGNDAVAQVMPEESTKSAGWLEMSASYDTRETNVIVKRYSPRGDLVRVTFRERTTDSDKLSTATAVFTKTSLAAYIAGLTVQMEAM